MLQPVAAGSRRPLDRHDGQHHGEHPQQQPSNHRRKPRSRLVHKRSVTWENPRQTATCSIVGGYPAVTRASTSVLANRLSHHAFRHAPCDPPRDRLPPDPAAYVRSTSCTDPKRLQRRQRFGLQRPFERARGRVKKNTPAGHKAAAGVFSNHELRADSPGPSAKHQVESSPCTLAVPLKYAWYFGQL